ncbi:hypothetical protein WG66_009608 [Moniliophthora roreri]|nr:hypothetical protein WG66_009608 [Moniliophthora roreri]
MLGAEKTVQSTFSDAINNGCLYGHKLEIITQSKLRLRKRAAERREKFQLNNSIWKNFIGIDIELVPDIVQWYTAAERLQRDILVFSCLTSLTTPHNHQIAVQHDSQYQCNAELSRREDAATTTIYPPSATRPEEQLPQSGQMYSGLDVDIGIEDQAPRPKSTWVLLLPDIRNTDDFTPSISTTTVLRAFIFLFFAVLHQTTAESNLDATFDNAVESGSLSYGRDRDLITETRLRLKRKASEIRSRSLQNSSSIWRTYLGFHPELLSEIIEWSNNAEKLRWDILAIVEDDNQHRYDIELNRRGNAANCPSIASPILPTASSSSTSQARILKSEDASFRLSIYLFVIRVPLCIFYSSASFCFYHSSPFFVEMDMTAATGSTATPDLWIPAIQMRNLRTEPRLGTKTTRYRHVAMKAMELKEKIISARVLLRFLNESWLKKLPG